MSNMNNAMLEFVRNEQVVILKKYITLKQQLDNATKNKIDGDLKSLAKQFNKNNEYAYTISGKRR